MEHTLRCLYLDLIEKCLVNTIYEDSFTDWNEKGQVRQFDAEKRRLGRDWPEQAHTMIGLVRMRNIRELVQRVLQDNIPGDLIETGVWRGGACIYMRAILAAHGEHDRRVFVADSFVGLPVSNAEKYPADSRNLFHQYPNLAISIDVVKSNFSKYGLLDEQVVFLQGWFKDTLPSAPIERLAILRLDGDMYESTMDSLVHLYHKVSPGGYVIIDDYGSSASCQQAVHDFCKELNISTQIINIDDWGAYWKKPSIPEEKSQLQQAVDRRDLQYSKNDHSRACKINIARAAIDRHSPIFSELIDLLVDSFRRLNIEVIVSTNHLRHDYLNIIIGQTLFLQTSDIYQITNSRIPYIAFQLEALDATEGFANKFPCYVDFLQQARSIWDYNDRNINYLLELGCTNVAKIQLGYSPVLERILQCGFDTREIDVLFYGSMSDRRRQLLEALREAGIKVDHAFGIYGGERDRRISRAKIILNLHQFETTHLETVRISYLLNNKCFVISEISDEDPYGGGVVFSPYGELVNCCKRYLSKGMEEERRRIAQLGYEQLKLIPMLQQLKEAVACHATGTAFSRK